MKRLFEWLEIVFMATFWWQTRFNLLRWFPSWRAPSATVDYLIPFISFSDILLLGILTVWLLAGGYAALSGKIHLLLIRPSLKQIVGSPWVWFGLLLVAAGLSLTINHSGAWGWYRWLKLLEGGVVAMWVWGRWRDGRWKLFGGLLLAGLGWESLLLLLEWIVQGSLGLQWLGEWQYGLTTPGVAKVLLWQRAYLRPMGTFAHPNIVAAVLVTSLPLAWWWATDTTVRTRFWLERFWMGHKGQLTRTWLILVFLGLLVTFSRAAWMVGFGYVVVYILWRYLETNKPRSIKKVSWTTVGAGGFIILAISPALWQRFGGLLTNDSWSVSLRWRLDQIAIEMWASHFWLGVGLNNFTLEVLHYHLLTGLAKWQQPVHNVALLVLAELGVLGFLALLGLCLSSWIWIGRLVWGRESHKPVVILGMMWAGVVILSFVDHYWWTSQQAFLAVWGLGGGTLLVGRMYDSSSEDKQEKKV